MFKILGLIPNISNFLGFPALSTQEPLDESKEQLLMPIFDMFMEIRSKVHEHVYSIKDTAMKLILEECDRFQDDELPLRGIQLEDKPTGSLWNLNDTEVLKKECEAKLVEMKREAEENLQKFYEQEKKDAPNRMPPVEFRKQLTLEDEVTLKYYVFGNGFLCIWINT